MRGRPLPSETVCVSLGPASRGGYTAIPNCEAEALFNRLRPEQFRLYLGLRMEAQFGVPGEVVDKFGRIVQLDLGEAIFGIEAAANRYGMSRDQVRRAIDTFERLGLLERRPGLQTTTPSAIPCASLAATPSRREAATPPTVLRFISARDLCWPPRGTATQHGQEDRHPTHHRSQGQAATIQTTNQQPTTTPSPPARGSRGARRGSRGGQADPVNDPRVWLSKLSEKDRTEFFAKRLEKDSSLGKEAPTLATGIKCPAEVKALIDHYRGLSLGQGTRRDCS